MSYIYNPFSRRSFIQGLGGAVAAPFLASLAPKEASAAMADSQRFIAISTPSQLPPSTMSPAGYGKVLTAPLSSLVTNRTDGIYPYREMDLAAVASAMGGNFSAMIDSKYNPYLSKMAVVRGLDMPGRIDHGAATALGNLAGCHMGHEKDYKPMLTMDEFLMNSTNFYTRGKVAYRFPIIRIGEYALSTSKIGILDGIGIAGNNSTLTMNGNLKNIFDYGFSNQASGMAKASVVDSIRSNVNSIKSGSKISSGDIQVLNQFMDLMNDLQKSLQNAVVPPAKPAMNFIDITTNTALAGTGDPINNTKNYYQDAAKLIVLALQCGLTKIATVGVGSSLYTPTEATFGGSGLPHDWHAVLAHGQDIPGLTAVNKFVTDNLFYEIMRGLDTMESGVGNYLDNTLIYYKPELSIGHSGVNFGTMIAGNANGGVKLGKLYDYSNWSHSAAGAWDQNGVAEQIAPGQPINRFWIGMMHSLGLTPADYQNKFGNGPRGFGIWENYAGGWEAFFAGIEIGTQVTQSLSGPFSK